MSSTITRPTGQWHTHGVYRHAVPTLAEARIEAQADPHHFAIHEIVTVVSGARALAEHHGNTQGVDAYAELGGVVGCLSREVDTDAGTVVYRTEISDFEAQSAGLFVLNARELSELADVCQLLRAELDAIERGE